MSTHWSPKTIIICNMHMAITASNSLTLPISSRVTSLRLSKSCPSVSEATLKHYSDVTMSAMASQITSVSTVCSAQPLVQVQIKENMKASRHWPLCREFIGDRWIPRTKGQERGKCHHLMTSSWNMCIYIGVLYHPYMYRICHWMECHVLKKGVQDSLKLVKMQLKSLCLG